tara:strand:- start:414 stop:695 length:282 start_codon:yes stop_codon:yes gene_type:complete
MKKQRKQNTKRLQRKHARAVARKNKGAQYGASVKAFNKLRPLMEERVEQVTVMGTDSREVLGETFVDTGKTPDTKKQLGEQFDQDDKGNFIIS